VVDQIRNRSLSKKSEPILIIIYTLMINDRYDDEISKTLHLEYFQISKEKKIEKQKTGKNIENTRKT
jgi:hypothetical protein